MNKCIGLIIASFMTCCMLSCSHSDDIGHKEQKELVAGVVNVTYEHDKAMQWHMPYGKRDYLAIYNESGDRARINSEYLSDATPGLIPADKCYKGRIPRNAKYVVFPNLEESDKFNDYRNYVMVFTDNNQQRRSHDHPSEYFFKIPNDYMCGSVEKDKDTAANLKVTMHHQTLEMNFPIQLTGKSSTRRIRAVEVSTVDGSEVFILRKHLFAAEGEADLIGSGITMFVADSSDTEDDFECRIHMLPFDLHGDQLQVKVYVMEDNQLYVSTIPLSDWGPIFRAGESYTMPIDYQTLSHELATSMLYTGSYVLSDDGKTLKRWTGWHPVINMESDENLCRIKHITDRAFLYTGCPIQQVILPNGLLDIAEEAFYDCSTLQKVDIPSSVRVLPKGCFVYCENLKECILHEGLTTIEKEAFGHVPPLQYLDLPSTLTSIGSLAINMGAMSYMISRAVVPPTLAGYMTLLNSTDKKVYVPAESIQAYQTSKYWRGCTFLPLEELEQ